MTDLPYPPPFMDLATLAQHICVSERSIENWVNLGQFPAPKKKIGGKRLWSWAEVNRFQQARDHVPVVYIVGFSIYVKIGYTSSLFDRIANIQVYTPERIKIYGAIGPASTAIESELHSHFSGLRLQGEWFLKEKILSDWIDVGCPYKLCADL